METINKGLTKMNYGENVAFLLLDEVTFSTTSYRVIQSDRDGCFVPCMRITFNGRDQLFYMNGGLSSLCSFMKTTDARQRVRMIADVLSIVEHIHNNGFLSCQNLLFDDEYVYVDLETKQIKLLYLPTEQPVFDTQAGFEAQLRHQLVQNLVDSDKHHTELIQKSCSLLSDKTLSLIELVAQVNRLVESIPTHEHKQTATLRLVGDGVYGNINTSILLDETVLGSKRDAVDIYIPSRTVSRIHCKIIRDKNEYSIVDLGSTNGTFVNKLRLSAHKPYPLRDHDRISMADVGLMVTIEKGD